MQTHTSISWMRELHQELEAMCCALNLSVIPVEDQPLCFLIVGKGGGKIVCQAEAGNEKPTPRMAAIRALESSLMAASIVEQSRTQSMALPSDNEGLFRKANRAAHDLLQTRSGEVLQWTRSAYATPSPRAMMLDCLQGAIGPEKSRRFLETVLDCLLRFGPVRVAQEQGACAFVFKSLRTED